MALTGVPRIQQEKVPRTYSVLEVECPAMKAEDV